MSRTLLRTTGNAAQQAGTSPLPNDFAGMSGGAGTLIGGTGPGQANTIAFNGGNGVDAFGIPILGNSIFANVVLGLPSSPTTPAFKTSPL